MLTSLDTSQAITVLLNSLLQSMTNVIPMSFTKGKPKILQNSTQLEYGVLIGLSEGLDGRLVIKGNPAIFSTVGEKMFGMALEGEMLESFTGELGNMIAGNLSTILATEGITIDITAPTVLTDTTEINDIRKAISLTISFQNNENMELLLVTGTSRVL